jgi:two-component system, sensor histidine kinase and response regulator
MKSVSNMLFGETESVFSEKKIFIIITFITSIYAIVGEVWNILLGFSFFVNLIISPFIIVYLLLYYYARFKNKYSPFILITINLFALSILFITNGGLTGSIPVLYIFALASFISITDHKYHKIVLLATIGNLVLLIVLEYFFFRNLVIKYNSLQAKELDLTFSYFSTLIGSFFLLSYFKNSIIKKNNELQKQNESKDLLFDIISHDLRGPINNILGLSEVMVDQIKELKVEELQKFSKLINLESKKNYELLDSLLEWGKINMDRIQIDKAALNIYQIVNEIAQFFEEMCRKKEVALNISIPEDIYVYSDKVALKTIFRNLISNAIKFTPKGGEVTISGEESDGKFIVIKVIDKGIGMNKQLIDNLFSPEINTNRTGVNGEKSVGLGLIITKELIEKQGGNLIIESEENHGSTFIFTVPKSDKSLVALNILLML